MAGTYQVQTNLSVQTPIWATGSTSKDQGGLGKFTINCPPLDWVITLLQIPLPLPLLSSLDVDLVAQIRVCTICMERLVCICYVPIVHSLHKLQTLGVVLKLDYEKAYDRVNLDFCLKS